MDADTLIILIIWQLRKVFVKAGKSSKNALRSVSALTIIVSPDPMCTTTSNSPLPATKTSDPQSPGPAACQTEPAEKKYKGALTPLKQQLKKIEMDYSRD